MNIKEMQEEVWNLWSKYNEKNNTSHNPETTFHQLIEEVGELARELGKEKNDWRKEGFNKEKLADELNDVICNCIVLARDYDIDLEESFKRKIQEWKVRWEIE